MNLQATSFLTMGLFLMVCPRGLSDEPLTGQAAVIAAIEKLGGHVVIDEKSPGKHAVEVYLSGPKVTDDVLKHVQNTTELQVLYLANTKITDAGLKHLAKLTKLRMLNLGGTAISDVGIVHLKGLTRLRCLQLNGSKVTKAGLKQLQGLPELRTSRLGNTKFFTIPPKGGNVVSKGKFSVWTVPADPQPGQNYHIVIQVELPKNTTRLLCNDLSGIVVGTDGYRQRIPGLTCGWLPVKGKQAQLAIFLPAAAKLVKDTITVRSKLLKETQTLEIVF